MGNIYRNGDYIKKNPLYHVDDSSWKAQQILRMIEQNKLRPQVICDVGCGAGEILKQLQLHMPKDTKFVGYDISPQAYELCKQRESDKLSFFCEDILQKETEPFNLLLCIDVFEHVEDYIGFLRKLRNKAKYKIFHIPLELSMYKLFRYTRLLENRAEVGHLHYFFKDTALLTLQYSGYEIVDYFYTPASYYKSKGLKAKLGIKLRSFIEQDLRARMWGGYSLMVLAS